MTSPALKLQAARQAHDEPREAAPAARGGNIGERAGQIGLEIAEINGIVEDLAKLGREQSEQLRGVVGAVKSTAAANAQLDTSMQEMGRSAQEARVVLSEGAQHIAETLEGTIGQMQALAHGVFNTTGSIAKVSETISKVQENSAAIQAIAFETRLIALNAGVEAARAGAAGHGFSVISNAIRSLADQVSAISTQNQSTLGELKDVLVKLAEGTRSNVSTAQSVVAKSSGAADASRRLTALVQSVEQLAGTIDAMSGPVQQNIDSGETVRTSLRSLVRIMNAAEQQVGNARARAEAILGIGEDFMVFVAESGIETPDQSMIALSKEIAGQVEQAFETALERGTIRLEDLFDERYAPIPNTNPEQVLTRFTQLTDHVLPAIQEAVLKRDARIAFCAAVDRNGYLPTHNKIYSQPQGPDPAWNAANSRNRRIFNDRTGLAAGRNRRPFLLQTYRRDMGNGNFVLMKDASAPITVRGRHWGGLRIGFKAGPPPGRT